jgi:hypothetical protein
MPGLATSQYTISNYEHVPVTEQKLPVEKHSSLMLAVGTGFPSGTHIDSLLFLRSSREIL